jgi:hypothetical protein
LESVLYVENIGDSTFYIIFGSDIISEKEAVRMVCMANGVRRYSLRVNGIN